MKLVRELVEQVELSRPVFYAKDTGYGDISLENSIGKPKREIMPNRPADDILGHMVVNGFRERFNAETRKYIPETDSIENEINYKLHEHLIRYTAEIQGLTGIKAPYQTHLQRFLECQAFKTNKWDEMFFSIYNYAITNDLEIRKGKDNVHCKNFLALLELVRKKIEDNK